MPPPFLSSAQAVASEEAGRRARHVSLAGERNSERLPDTAELDLSVGGCERPSGCDHDLMERRKRARHGVVDDLLSEGADENSRSVAERLGLREGRVSRGVAVERELAGACDDAKRTVGDDAQRD